MNTEHKRINFESITFDELEKRLRKFNFTPQFAYDLSNSDASIEDLEQALEDNEIEFESVGSYPSAAGRSYSDKTYQEEQKIWREKYDKLVETYKSCLGGIEFKDGSYNEGRDESTLVVYFPLHNIFIMAIGSYNSYDGTNFDGVNWVQALEQRIEVFEYVRYDRQNLF